VSRPRLLDGCCCAGGAGKGYHDAGFDVTGVDNRPQPSYPFTFIRADILDVLADPAFLSGFDAVHVSPPCQHKANVTRWRGSQAAHPDVLTPVLALLGPLAIPWVVENVPEALPTWDLLLCGSNFGLQVKRHRGFRFGNWAGFDLLPPCQHRGLRPFMHKDERAYADAMGCTWMSKTEARQAVPPDYTRFIGKQLRDHLRAAA
jgi:DNA (cytosine-5)-methyltransferase 1